MMDVKVSELSGAALDWAVAKCEGTLGFYVQPNEKRGTTKWKVIPSTRRYSTNWAQGGPIIEQEGIGTWPSVREGNEGQWGARMADTYIAYGPTPLIAAMRCFVASKLGDVVSIPDELI